MAAIVTLASILLAIAGGVALWARRKAKTEKSRGGRITALIVYVVFGALVMLFGTIVMISLPATDPR